MSPFFYSKGESAEVELLIKLGNGKEHTEHLRLKKVDGTWYLGILRNQEDESGVK